jgi:hypothetical protein
MTGTAEPGVVVATAVTKSRLASARTLAGSLRRHHPAVPVVVLLVDEANDLVEPGREPFRIVMLPELGIPRLRRFLFQYTAKQAAAAVKPHLLGFLLDEGLQCVVFLDPDLLVLGDLHPLFEAARRSAISLTPHLVSPVGGEDRAARELNILVSGIYNAGVLGVSSCPSARSFLEWWRERLWSHCREATESGMHFDQRWLDLVPALFDGVEIIRDPAYNVGHWRLPDPTAAACRLAHFSGYSPEHPGQVTRYSDRLTMADLGEAAGLFARYRDELLAAGYEETTCWPYAYGRFDNGVAIPEIVRTIYLDLGERVERFGDPFRAAGSAGFFRWLNEPAGPQAAGEPITHLWEEIHRRRPDLRHAFPHVLDGDREAFLHWVAAHGRRELEIPDELAPRSRP